MRPHLALGLMYGCIVKPPSSLLYASCINTDDFPRVPACLRRPYDVRADSKVAQAIRNGRRAVQRRNFRKARYWVKVGDRWSKKIKNMSYTLLSDTTRKARKEHDCIWCPEKILKGESYLDERSVFDGNMQNHHWHPECRSAASQWLRENNEEEFQAHQCKRGTGEEA